MKWFLLFLLFSFFKNGCCKKFSFKFIHTPIYKSNPVCLFHKSVILINNETQDIYAIDFSPVENISSPNVLIKILLGQKVKGKIRISNICKELYDSFSGEPFRNNFYATNTKIFENNDYCISCENMKKLEKQDSGLVSIIKCWEKSFQLYDRNCHCFCHFLEKHY